MNVTVHTFIPVTDLCLGVLLPRQQANLILPYLVPTLSLLGFTNSKRKIVKYYSPGRHFYVRLACVNPTASIHPAPISNANLLQLSLNCCNNSNYVLLYRYLSIS